MSSGFVAAAVLWGLASLTVIAVTMIFIPFPSSVPFFAIALALALLAISLTVRPGIVVAVASVVTGLLVTGYGVWDRIQAGNGWTSAIAYLLFGFGVAGMSLWGLRQFRGRAGRDGS